MALRIKHTGLVGELDGAVVRLRPMTIEERLGAVVERMLLEWGQPCTPGSSLDKVKVKRGYRLAVRQVKVRAELLE